MTTAKLSSIDEYIAGFPKELQAILKQMQATIRNAAPDAEQFVD
jgi:uncharacterized protein YdhG (YjbR/CyaY superfamily)